MTEYIFSAAAPVVTAFIMTALCIRFRKFKNKKDKKSFIKKSCIFTAVFTAMLLLLRILTSVFTQNSEGPSAADYICVSLICYAAFILSDFQNAGALKNFMKRTGIICLAVFLAESLLFNFKSFTAAHETFTPSFNDLTTSSSEVVAVKDNHIEISGDVQLTFNVEKEDINALEIRFSGQDRWFRCEASIEDENFSMRYAKVDDKYLSVHYGKYEASFAPYKKLHSVRLDFKEVDVPVEIVSISLSSALPYNFSQIRFYILLVISTMICAVFTFSIYKKVYNRRSLRHRCAAAAAVILSVASVLVFLIPDQATFDYDTIDITYQDPYIQMFDSVKKGINSIDVKVDPNLDAMKNPYDKSVRDEQKIMYIWDRAYYNGKIYSYFGIAPVFTFYFPYYLLKGKLPTVNMALIFFGFFASLALSGTILTYAKHYIKKPNLMLLLLSILAAGPVSGILLSVDFNNFYILAGISSTCFLFICLWSGFAACNKKSALQRNVLFVICAAAFIACVTSRPSKALSALVLAPAFIGFLISKDKKLKPKLISVAAFLIPVEVGMCAIMIYNNARFGSPTQFGAVYQMTVSNINANHLRLSLLPQAVFNYLAAPLKIRCSFPFIEFANNGIDTAGQYIYTGFSSGALSYPLILTGFLILPFYLARRKHEDEILSQVRVKKYTYALMAVIAVGVAWLDFCMGGVILSYVFDITPVLTIMSVFLVLETHDDIVRTGLWQTKSFIVFSVIFAADIILVMLELVCNNEMVLLRNNHNIYFIMEDLISFWN